MKRLMTIVLMTVGCHVLMADDSVERKGNRLLGIGINEGSIGFDKAFPVAKSVGMQFVELPQQWDEIEPKPGKFTNQWLDIANAYYPQVGIRLVISLNAIDTNSLRLPEDLKGKPFEPFILRPQDIVYIPRTQISDVNLWIEQYITKMIPAIRLPGGIDFNID